MMRPVLARRARRQDPASMRPRRSQRPAARHARTHADARRLRATLAVAEHECRRRARARSARHQHRSRARGGLLRRDRLSPERAGSGPRTRTPQHRRMVAARSKPAPKRSSRRRAAAARSSRNTATCCATIRATPPRRGASANWRAIWAKCLRELPLEQLQRRTARPARRVSLPVHAAACAEARRRGGRRARPARLRSRAGARCAPVLRIGGHVFVHAARARSHSCATTSSTRSKAASPDVIATANIGCQTHLGAGGRTPVRHWIEIVDEAIA